MKHSLTVLVAFLLLTTSAVYAQPVQSAPYTGTPAGTSSGDVLWSQLDDPSGSAFTDQAFEAVYGAYDSDGAEDFIVEAGWNEWRPESLFTPGSVTVAGGSPRFVNVAFYQDAGGLPGVVASGCDFPANTNFTSDDGNLTIGLSGCNLGGLGRVWFSHQVRQNFHPFGQHFWATRNTANGTYPGVWKNPGNGFGSTLR